MKIARNAAHTHCFHLRLSILFNNIQMNEQMDVNVNKWQ